MTTSKAIAKGARPRRETAVGTPGELEGEWEEDDDLDQVEDDGRCSLCGRQDLCDGTSGLVQWCGDDVGWRCHACESWRA